MTRTVLGLDWVGDAVELLRRDFAVVRPHILYSSEETPRFNVNFDLLFLHDQHWEWLELLPELRELAFGTRRYDKLHQQLLLTSMGIATPPTYALLQGEGNRTPPAWPYTLTPHLSDEQELIIKMNDGARGIGQVLLRKNDLTAFFGDVGTAHVHEEGYEYLYKKWKLGGEHRPTERDQEGQIVLKALSDNDYVVQRRVKVEGEWRVIFLHGQEPLVLQRSTTEGWQANASITKQAKLVNPRDLGPKFQELCDKFSTWLRGQRAPFQSVDVYLDAELGTYGIFEFQTQFGYAWVPKTLLCAKLNEATTQLVTELRRGELPWAPATA